MNKIIFGTSFLAVCLCMCCAPITSICPEKPKLAVSVDPIKLDDVEFKVLKQPDATYIAVTVNDYKTLANNMDKLKAYIVLQNQVLKQYKTYYEE